MPCTSLLSRAYISIQGNYPVNESNIQRTHSPDNLAMCACKCGTTSAKHPHGTTKSTHCSRKLRQHNHLCFHCVSNAQTQNQVEKCELKQQLKRGKFNSHNHTKLKAPECQCYVQTECGMNHHGESRETKLPRSKVCLTAVEKQKKRQSDDIKMTLKKKSACTNNQKDPKKVVKESARVTHAKTLDRDCQCDGPAMKQHRPAVQLKGAGIKRTRMHGLGAMAAKNWQGFPGIQAGNHNGEIGLNSAHFKKEAQGCRCANPAPIQKKKLRSYCEKQKLCCRHESNRNPVEMKCYSLRCQDEGIDRTSHARITRGNVHLTVNVNVTLKNTDDRLNIPTVQRDICHEVTKQVAGQITNSVSKCIRECERKMKR